MYFMKINSYFRCSCSSQIRSRFQLLARHAILRLHRYPLILNKCFSENNFSFFSEKTHHPSLQYYFNFHVVQCVN